MYKGKYPDLIITGVIRKQGIKDTCLLLMLNISKNAVTQIILPKGMNLWIKQFRRYQYPPFYHFNVSDYSKVFMSIVTIEDFEAK